MSDPAATSPSEDPVQAIEAEVQQAIDLCNGDLRAALRATLIANAFLEAEVERLSAAVSAGFSRGKIRRRPKAEDTLKIAARDERKDEPA